MYLECIKDINEYKIFKGSLWKIKNIIPNTYYIEVENYIGERFIINEKWSCYFKFIG